MSENHLSLVDLLSTVRGSGYGVTDPKDRVLALLGLAREREELYRLYQPDYKQSLTDIYCSISRLAIQISGSTEILSYASSNSGIPSWAPDWLIGSSREDWDQLHSTLDSITGTLFRSSAASTSVLYIEERVPANVLTLKGVLFDTVEDCHLDRKRSLPSTWKYIQERQRRYKVQSETFFCADVVRQFEDNWLTEAINRDTFAGVLQDEDPMLTILLVMNELWSDAKGMLRRINKYVVHSLRKFLLEDFCDYEDDEFCDDLERFERTHGMIEYQEAEFFMPNIDAPLSKETLLNIYRMAKQKTTNQLIGRTKRGYLMTSSCWELEKGDAICVFLGGSVPYALRLKDDHYILMGEVYVHGIMDGEVMEAVDRHEHVRVSSRSRTASKWVVAENFSD